jgi:U3 small nucleolar RNA-associated protein MPP10
VGNERERAKAKREREKEAKEKAAEDAGFTRKAPKVAMLAAAPAGGRSKSEFSKSSKVFGMLQEAKEADARGLGKPKKSDGMKNKASLKL